jgi:hypothetical protein
MKKLLAITVGAMMLASVSGVSAAPPYKIPPGQYCAALSKKKISGQKKSPFAQCVVAMAQIDKKHSTSPAKACAPLVKGAKGKAGKKAATKAFKQCQDAGKKFKKDLG